MDFRIKASFVLYNIKADFVQPWWIMFTWWYALSLHIKQITFRLWRVNTRQHTGQNCLH